MTTDFSRTRSAATTRPSPVATRRRTRAGLAERAGQSLPSRSLDVYTHVMPVEEITEEHFAVILV